MHRPIFTGGNNDGMGFQNHLLANVSTQHLRRENDGYNI